MIKNWKFADVTWKKSKLLSCFYCKSGTLNYYYFSWIRSSSHAALLTNSKTQQHREIKRTCCRLFSLNVIIFKKQVTFTRIKKIRNLNCKKIIGIQLGNEQNQYFLISEKSSCLGVRSLMHLFPHATTFLNAFNTNSMKAQPKLININIINIPCNYALNL